MTCRAANVAALLDWTREHDAQRHGRLAAATRWWMTHWALDLVRADALDLTGRQQEADALVRPLLALAPPGSWKQFWPATKTADFALHARRYAEALELYGVAMQALRRFSSPMGEVIQADTIAPTLLHLGRIEEAATTLAICELVHAELSWPAVGFVARCLDEVRSALDDEQVEAARQRARELGMTRGLAWVGAVARGEQVAAS